MSSELKLKGSEMTPRILSLAARSSMKISVHESSLERMSQNRKFAEAVADRGDEVYGLTTGVGMRKKRRITKSDMANFNKRMIREHATGLGPPIPSDVTRASGILLLNTLAMGRSNVRPEIAQQFSHRLTNGPPLAPLPMYGDVTPLAHLVSDLLGDMEPVGGEALPLIAQSSVVTAHASLAIQDLHTLLETFTVLAVLDIEAYSTTLEPYHPIIGQVRPYPGYQKALHLINSLLEGSSLRTTPPRHLQSPLTFRGAASVLGSAFDTYRFCEQQVTCELNSHQQNPLACHEENRMIPTANFDMQPLAAAMDFARISLASCISAQNERSMKLLQASETGLTDGLEPPGDEMGHGLSEIAWPLQAMATEARLLTQPVSTEIGSSTQAEGIEDRMTMAGLGARRLAEMVDLGFRCAAISVVIACQAIDLRLGTGAGIIHQVQNPTTTPPLHSTGSIISSASNELEAQEGSKANDDSRTGEKSPIESSTFYVGGPVQNALDKVREIVPMMVEGDAPPATLEPLVAALKKGLLRTPQPL